MNPLLLTPPRGIPKRVPPQGGSNKAPPAQLDDIRPLSCRRTGYAATGKEHAGRNPATARPRTKPVRGKRQHDNGNSFSDDLYAAGLAEKGRGEGANTTTGLARSCHIQRSLLRRWVSLMAVVKIATASNIGERKNKRSFSFVRYRSPAGLKL